MLSLFGSSRILTVSGIWYRLLLTLGVLILAILACYWGRVIELSLSLLPIRVIWRGLYHILRGHRWWSHIRICTLRWLIILSICVAGPGHGDYDLWGIDDHMAVHAVMMPFLVETHRYSMSHTVVINALCGC